jgi:predicted hydrocarbon binding protein/ActR/RegA family two-component response regulator
MAENEILNEIEYDGQKGALHYKGVRYLLIRPETLAAMQKAMESVCGKEAGEIIFQGGFEGGLLSAKKYKELHEFSKEGILDFMVMMGSQLGWGAFHLSLFDPAAGRLTIEVGNSPFAAAYGEASEGVCHFIRGVVSGLATVILGKNITASETSCIARGDRKCSFVVGDNTDMKEHQRILKGKRILIVDDEPDILSTLKDILDECKISVAESFEEAERLLSEGSFDGAILDIMGVNGYDLLSIATKKGVPTLMLTAHALSIDDFVKSIEIGARAYVPKDKIADIEIFLADLFEVHKKKGKRPGSWFTRLEPFFRQRFGADWKEKAEPEFWEKYYYL